jgi:hypothetical protein
MNNLDRGPQENALRKISMLYSFLFPWQQDFLFGGPSPKKQS